MIIAVLFLRCILRIVSHDVYDETLIFLVYQGKSFSGAYKAGHYLVILVKVIV